MSSDNTAGAKISSAPVVEVFDAAAAMNDPIFPENEDWDEDDFGGGESVQAEGKIDGVVQPVEKDSFSTVVVVADHTSSLVDNSSGDMVSTQQPFPSLPEKDLTAAESSSNNAGGTLMNDTSKGKDCADHSKNNNNIIDVDYDNNSTTAKTASAKLVTTNVKLSEKRRQRRERRQKKQIGRAHV